MSAFEKKQIEPAKRICLRLKDLRKSRRVSLKQMEERTKLSRKHLIALEKCNFEDLPSGEIYQKNFVRCYVRALGADPAPYLRQFLEEEAAYMKQECRVHPRQHVGFSKLSNIPALFRYLGATVVVAVLIGYLGIQVKHTVEPPALTLVSPQDGMISEEPRIMVQGATDKEVRISINGKDVVGDEEGQFEQVLELGPGLNTIVVTAETKHGKRSSETRHVVVRQAPETS